MNASMRPGARRRDQPCRLAYRCLDSGANEARRASPGSAPPFGVHAVQLTTGFNEARRASPGSGISDRHLAVVRFSLQ